MRLLAILMTTLALVLTACGGTDTTDTGDPGTTTPDDTNADAPDDTDTDEEPTDTDEPTEGPADEPTDEPAEEPADDAGTDDEVAAGDCSAAGLDGTVRGDDLSEEARTSAAFLLDAAVRCDEQLLFTAAEESGTSFFFDSAAVDEVLVLPEDPDADPSAWEALARLLGSTTPVMGDGGIWTWPAAAAPDAGDDAWQELVDSSLYTQAQVDELRTAGEGYLGWRIGIADDGTWLFFTAGD